MKTGIIDTAKRLVHNKNFICIACSAFVCILSIILSCFINIPGQISYILFSAFAIILLLLMTRKLFIRYVNIDNRKLTLIASAITSLLGLIIYVVIVYGRNFEYVFDHTCYYDQQHELLNLFLNNPLKGFAGIILSFWNSDYSYFINVILGVPFLLTDGSHEAYVITYYIVLLIPVIIMYNVLVTNACQKFSIDRKLLFIFISNFLFLTFPLIHMASIMGMPDLFGMFFVFSITLIMFNANFLNTGFKFCFEVALLSIMLVITRRWYLFWLLGFIPCILILSFIKSIHVKNMKKVFFGELKFALVYILTFFILMGPFIYKTLFVKNYAEDYSQWYIGGFWYEWYNQLGYLGILFAIILVIGIVYGLINKELRFQTIVCIFGLVLSIYFFTLVQNMGKHQSLCLLGYYLVFAHNFLLFAVSIKNRLLRGILLGFVFIVLIFNSVSTMACLYDDINGLFLTTKYAIGARFSWK